MTMRQVGGLAAITMVMMLGACKSAVEVAYPACQTDEQCKAQGEVCVNQQCQQCAEDSHCLTLHPNGSHTCSEGQCLASACTQDSDCQASGATDICSAGKCIAGCLDDAMCGLGEACENNRCLAKNCASDDICGAGRHCQAGMCVSGVREVPLLPEECRSLAGADQLNLESIYFAFNAHDLSPEARDALARSVECLEIAQAARITIEGHADERGTQEYNLALGEKRANTVPNYLRNMGVDLSRLTTRSMGENKPLCNEANQGCWAQNRRVSFIIEAR